MKNQTKKLLGVVMLSMLLTFGAFDLTAFAYPAKPTMDSTWGFPSDGARNIKTRYRQNDDIINWANNVEWARVRYKKCPALVSFVVGDYDFSEVKISIYSYDLLDDTKNGRCRKKNGWYEVSFNSRVAVDNGYGDDTKNALALHEISHAYGLNDCENTGYVMYGWTHTTQYFTDYETNLLINRYGR